MHTDTATEMLAEGITLTPEGAGTRLVLTTNDGTAVAPALLIPACAGALGGQLLSAAHRPLQHPFTLTLREDPAATTTPPTMPAPISPMALARRPHPATTSPTAAAAENSPQWRFTNSALEHLAKHKLTRDQVVEVVDNPEVVAPAEFGGGTTYTRNGIGAVVPADEPHLVIAVFRDNAASRTPSRSKS